MAGVYRWLLGLVAAAACAPVLATNAIPPWSMIPQPAQAVPAGHGAVTVSNGDTVASVTPDDVDADRIVSMFIDHAQTLRGLHLVADTDAAGARIVLRLDPGAAIDSDAGYRIDIGDNRIRATARTARGLFYASVSVGQLLTPDAARGTVRVADGRIEDAPRYRWRGFMLDSARHFQSVEQIRRIIDWMALHKLDRLHWHLTDDQGWRLQIKRYPKLTGEASCRRAVGPDAALTGGPDKPYCGYYTQDQVRALVRYAADRFITIVPEIEVPGHAQAALHAYPELGVTGERPPVSTDWGINTWLYAPNRRSLTFLENVLDEVMALFPSRYIHIGGDEAAKDQWEASAAAQAQRKKLGLDNMDQLQGWMVGQVGRYLARHGRTMIGWDEILDGGTLPDSAVVMSWHGVDGAVAAAAKGHDTILSPSPTLYLDHVQSDAHDEPPGRPQPETLQDIHEFNPHPDSIAPDAARHILGLQANLWAEYMPTFARAQHAMFPRMAAWAEVAWSPASAIDWSSFLRRMPAQLARYRALGIAYADSAWRPRIRMQASGDRLTVTLDNQTGQGRIRYTTDGSTPHADSTPYTGPLAFPADTTTRLAATTFDANGTPLSRPHHRDIRRAALRTRNSDRLATCSKKIPLRIEDDRPLDGHRPVYKVDIADTCWIWHAASLDGMTGIRVRVGNLPWNYALWKDTDAVIARPSQGAHGEIEVHLDRCDGPLLARLPLAKAATHQERSTLEATLPATRGRHDVCLFATGDPRHGVIWAVDTVEWLPGTR